MTRTFFDDVAIMSGGKIALLNAGVHLGSEPGLESIRLKMSA